MRFEIMITIKILWNYERQTARLFMFLKSQKNDRQWISNWLLGIRLCVAPWRRPGDPHNNRKWSATVFSFVAGPWLDNPSGWMMLFPGNPWLPLRPLESLREGGILYWPCVRCKVIYKESDLSAEEDKVMEQTVGSSSPPTCRKLRSVLVRGTSRSIPSFEVKPNFV